MSAAQASTPAAWREHESGPPLARSEVGVLFFLAGEVMFFAGLIAAALVLRAGDPGWGASRAHLALGPAVVGTGLLASSSLVLGLALRRGRALRVALLACAGLGLAFVAVQAIEYDALLNGGLRWTSDVFGSCFFVLTAVHGLHVLGGVSWLLVLALGGSGVDGQRVRLASWYWHLVDVVWIGLFTFFYVLRP